MCGWFLVGWFGSSLSNFESTSLPGSNAPGRRLLIVIDRSIGIAALATCHLLASMSSPTRLPELPIVCLKSANCHTTLDAFVGKNAVIGEEICF